MTHTLDNPIWNALTTHNQIISKGNQQAKYFDREIAAFAGLKDNSESDLNSLYEFMPLQTHFILFTPGDIVIPSGWKIILKKSLLQMVYQPSTSDRVLDQETDDSELVALQEKHVAAMLELTGQTNPGPFFSRTIEFGNYKGIFDGDRLVAMAGQRMRPVQYTEVSAVCTHPDYLGKGYAGKLVRYQIKKICSESRIPFLHVYTDNTSAYTLYEKLGFRTRREMMVYVIEKQDK